MPLNRMIPRQFSFFQTGSQNKPGDLVWALGWFMVLGSSNKKNLPRVLRSLRMAAGKSSPQTFKCHVYGGAAFLPSLHKGFSLDRERNPVPILKQPRMECRLLARRSSDLINYKELQGLCIVNPNKDSRDL